MRKSLCFMLAVMVLGGCGFSRYHGCDERVKVCEYQDPIMLKHPHSQEVVVCRPDSNVLLEDCARAYERYGFIRMHEYPMFVPGAVRINDKYYSSYY